MADENPVRFYDVQTDQFRGVEQKDVDLMALGLGLFGALRCAIPILWQVAHAGMSGERDFAGKCGATELLRQAAEESAKQDHAFAVERGLINPSA